MRVLIAEDDPISRRMLEAFLVKWGYEVVVATQGEEAWRVLQGNDPPKLAVLDWMMPGKDGIELCRGVRQRKGQAYIYILLLTARGHKEDILEGLEAGADDYVTKPFDPYELQARLRTGRRIIELQEQLLSAREALRDQASRDPLTDLWNHKAILGILRKEVARASRTQSPLAVAMIDVDRFKTTWRAMPSCGRRPAGCAGRCEPTIPWGVTEGMSSWPCFLAVTSRGAPASRKASGLVSTATPWTLPMV